MPSCAAIGCTNRPSKNLPGITFHRFPRKKEIREAWIKALRREKYIPSNTAVVCSEHFIEEDFDRTSCLKTRIKENSIPSVFKAFPNYLQKKLKKRRLPKDRTCFPLSPYQEQVSSTSHSSNSIPSLPEKSPSKEFYKRKLDDATEKIKKYRKKIHSLQQTKRRQKKKIDDLTSFLSELKQKHFIDNDILETLNQAVGPNKEFLLRQLSKVTSLHQPTTYSEELKTFALMLHFYSPRAYNYVRNTFQTCLPHTRTIGKWYKKLDGSPGFTEEAFRMLTKYAEYSSYPILCSLLIDEMAIRQYIEWDGKVFHGYVNIGSEPLDDSLPIAKDALVFMAVGINTNWKIPLGYFLINKMTSEQRANLLKQCLKLCSETGIKVVSITFDGLAANISMVKQLGCCFDIDNINPTFCHPATNEKVALFLDACHMVKLVRNTLGDKKLIFDEDNNKIEWNYVKELHELQEIGVLHLGNKLRSAHISFYKQKMNVKLATQLLSESVADSIEFCDKILQLPKFKNSEATVKFIRIVNKLFDILNSRNVKQFGYKKPINPRNEQDILTFLDESYNYIKNLKVSNNGMPITHSNRKTGFIGLLVSMKSLQFLYLSLIKTNSPLLQYLPAYKMSQDHLELFFSLIRQNCGWNNNPTARQFRAAYKKL